MRAILTTLDPIKLGAARAVLEAAGVRAVVFDSAAGALWRAIIPLRLMAPDEEANDARRALRQAGFVEAADGDWDLKADRRAP